VEGGGRGTVRVGSMSHGRRVGEEGSYGRGTEAKERNESE
jgi:hypothetical protein